MFYNVSPFNNNESDKWYLYITHTNNSNVEKLTLYPDGIVFKDNYKKYVSYNVGSYTSLT